MNKSELRLLLLTTFVAFCALYAPQPILPRLAEEFGVSASDASLLISATLLPLGLAPIIYGYLIEAVPARLLLLFAIATLIIGHLMFAMADSYWMLLTARIIEGLSFPAIFTAIMTYLSTTAAPDSVRRIIGYYVAVTICGGFAGRLFSGVIASHYGWRLTFYLLALALIIVWFAVRRLSSSTTIDFAKLDKKAIVDVLQEAKYRNGLLVIFFVFFVFASVLNALPFRLREIDPSISDTMISMVYAGYLIGVVVALQASKLSRLFGSDVRVVQVAIVLLTVTTAAFAFSDPIFSLINMFGFVAGMFMVHSILSGFLNHLATKRKGVVNGLYISFYYAGGAIGSWLPTIIYSRFGWNTFISVLVLTCLLGFYFSIQLKKSSAK